MPENETTTETAEQRLRRRVLDLVRRELERQDQKWGTNRDLDARDWITILGEEFGEVCNASLEHTGAEHWVKELVEVAAVACAAVENVLRLERERDDARPEIGDVPKEGGTP